MGVWEGIFLGVIQGLTEFLPVSSSGHLVIMRYFFGLKEAGVTFGVLVHLGTLFAVFIAFWGDLLGLLGGISRLFSSVLKFRVGALRSLLREDPSIRLLFMLFVASIPAGVIGLTFVEFFEEVFKSPSSAGVMLIITGLMLWFVSRSKAGRKSPEGMSIFDSLVVGVAQAVAILPGISRSGATITGALLRGLDREGAARFSFLLAIPAILGATLLEGRELINALQVPGGEGGVLVGGFLAAFISGYVAIKFFLTVLKRGRLEYFAYYCWSIGVLALLFIR